MLWDQFKVEAKGITNKTGRPIHTFFAVAAAAFTVGISFWWACVFSFTAYLGTKPGANDVVKACLLAIIALTIQVVRMQHEHAKTEAGYPLWGGLSGMFWAWLIDDAGWISTVRQQAAIPSDHTHYRHHRC
jgi:hypothetical protein